VIVRDGVLTVPGAEDILARHTAAATWIQCLDR